MQEDLNFDGCSMSPESFESLSQAVSNWHHLTVLDLANDFIFGHTQVGVRFCAQPLAESLAHHSSLQRLVLRDRRFTEPVASVLLPPLAMHHKGLRHLDLGVIEDCDSRFSIEQQIQYRFPGLSELTNLTLLSLPEASTRSGHLPVIPGTEVADALPHLYDLQDLNLSNAVWACSVEVVRSLSTLTRLTRLSLDGGCIDVPTAFEVGCSLRCLLKLEDLSMNDNILRGCGCKLAGALGNMTSLCHVSMCDSELKEGEAVELIEALENLPQLTTLELTGNVSAEEYYRDGVDWLGQLVHEVTEVFRKPWVTIDLPDPPVPL